MRSYFSIAAVVAAATLSGCVCYPVYQPAPVARLTPAQSAALASRPVDPADRERYAAADAQAQRDDQAGTSAAPAYTYVYPAAPYYDYGYYPGPYYYGGFYPWYPGLSLSFGFRGGYGYRGGYRGGFRHR